MKLLKLAVLLSFLSCASRQSTKIPDTGKSGLDTAADMYSVNAGDTSMNAAITKAKNTISEFDIALKSNNPDYSDFAVKKKYDTEDGGEHMWISVMMLTNGNYRGVVNNDAENTTEVKFGDTVVVKKSEITDWMYLEKNVLRGGYTIREIRNRLNQEERKKMDGDMGIIVED
jgi:uncharacterized protein YegJ (DUF2314 family)